MTMPTPKKFDDEYDNYYTAKRMIVNSDNYKEKFLNLYKYFKSGKTTITMLQYQTLFTVPNYSTAYQNLFSFTILNLLRKIDKNQRVKFYAQINTEWWEQIYTIITTPKHGETDANGQ